MNKRDLMAGSSLAPLATEPTVFDTNIIIHGASNSEGADMVPPIYDTRGRPWAEIEAHIRRCEEEGRRFPYLLWTQGAPDYDTEN